MAKPAAITKAAEGRRSTERGNCGERSQRRGADTKTQASSSIRDSEGNRKNQSVSQSIIHRLTQELSGS